MATPTPQPNPDEFNPTLTGAALNAGKGKFTGGWQPPSEGSDHPAIELLKWIFQPGDLVVVIDNAPVNWSGIVKTAAEAATPEFMEYLRQQNARGANIYFCPNPVKSATPSAGHDSARYRENIAAIRALAGDVDVNAEAVHPIWQSLTPPGFVQETSPGKFQKIWKTEFTPEEFQRVVSVLVRSGADPKCKDIPHVYRLPGFVNNKPAYGTNPPTVTPTQFSKHVATVGEFAGLFEKFPEPEKPTFTAKEGGLTFLKCEVGLEPAEARIGPITLKENMQCPFEDESDTSSNRSFAFVESDQGYPIFRCHHEGVCGKKGDIFDFVALYDGISIGDAIRKVRDDKFGDRETYEMYEAQYKAKLAEQAQTEFDALVPSETAKVEVSAPVESQPQSEAPQAEAPKKPINADIEDVPVHPAECIDGDYIGELSRLLVAGTFIPPQFIRQNIKVVLGHILDERITFPAMPTMHMRRFNFLISKPEGGKGESWNRTGNKPFGYLNDLVVFFGIHLADGSGWGSGQFMSKYLSKNPNSICYFDEGVTLFKQAQVSGSTLETVFLQLFEGKSVAQGSFKNGETHADNVRLSVTGGFTDDSFAAAFTSAGSQGSGFLSRVELAASTRTRVDDDWPATDNDAVKAVVEKIRAKIEALGPAVGNQPRVALEETPEAKEMRLEFQKWINTQPGNLTSRLLSHFKRDLTLRAFFTGDGVITADLTARSIAWAKDQIELRARFFPEDAGGPVERFEQKIRAQLAKHGPLSDRDLVKYCNVKKSGSGGSDAYGRAIKALLYSSKEIEVVSSTKKKKPIYGLSGGDE